MTKRELTDFCEEVLAAGKFEGTYYLPLDDCYFLVFAWMPAEYCGEESGEYLCGKIAYNCDDLQCDYDCDWYMPDVNGEIYDSEMTDCADLTPDVLADNFYDEYNRLRKYLKNKII